MNEGGSIYNGSKITKLREFNSYLYLEMARISEEKLLAKDEIVVSHNFTIYFSEIFIFILNKELVFLFESS